MAVFILAKRHPFLPSGTVSRFYLATGLSNVSGGSAVKQDFGRSNTLQSVPTIKRGYFGTRNKLLAVKNGDMYRRIN